MMVNTDEFVIDVIRAGGWDLRFDPQHFPYASLPKGFGGFEKDIRLRFNYLGSKVRVSGYIDKLHLLKRIKKPTCEISVYQTPESAAKWITSRLLPEYKKAWQDAQPLLAELEAVKGEREEASHDLALMMHFYRSFDPARGIEILTSKNAELIVNHDLSVSMKLEVDLETAMKILKTMKQSTQTETTEPCPACGGEGHLPDGRACGFCKTEQYVTRRAAQAYKKANGDTTDEQQE